MRPNSIALMSLAATVVLGACASGPATQPRMKMTEPMPVSITTPDEVKTSIGTLEYFDGVPTHDTVDLLYDYVDRARAVQVFIDMLPAVSMYQLRQGQRDIGAKECHQILIWDELMDSKSLVLTGNNTSLYTWGFLDLEKDGPTVIELPADVLGILDDAYMRYLGDMGAAGPDKGKGGKYLVLPPGYEGDVPSGYYVVKSPTYCVWNMMRGYVRDSVKTAADGIKSKLRVYPLSRQDDPPKMEFIGMSGRKGYNTVPPNDFSFYELLDKLIQEEPIEFLDPELRGTIAAIGIVKGKPFKPDDRMRRILTDAVAIANGYARANTVFPRDPGQRIYQGTDSEWVMAFADKSTAFEIDGARRMDSRLWMHYNAIAVTPAMALTKPGAGSDYAIAGLDGEHEPLDGAATYKLHLPPNVPVKDNWSVTIYDTQSRCMLQTDQRYAGINSSAKGLKKNADGSFDIYFAPMAPAGHEGNWIQTIPGKSWFIILRAYGPLQPWIDQTWRPGEIELVEGN